MIDNYKMFLKRNSTFESNELDTMNDELSKIESWVKKTTEHYDDWDWDGETLTIYGDDVEKYSREDLKEEGIL